MALAKTLSLNFISILLFTLMYFTISKAGGEQFNGLDKESSFLDHLYFAFTVQSTVGFGDIYPISPMAKMIVMVQQSVLILGVLELISEAKSVANVVPTVMKKMI
jgi:hypothetical protein